MDHYGKNITRLILEKSRKITLQKSAALSEGQTSVKEIEIILV